MIEDFIMRHFSRSQIHEALIYIVLWTIVFTAPVIDNYSKLSNGLSTVWQWDGVLSVWVNILPFLILFLIHELWLLPKMLMCKRYMTYILFVFLFLGLFSLEHELIRPFRPVDFPKKHFKENRFRNNPIEKDSNIAFDDALFLDENMEGMPPMDDEIEIAHKPRFEKISRGEKFGRHNILFPPSLIRMVIAILMLGLNIGIRFLFKSQRDEQTLRELEKHNLTQELEYLKYQINPHFFMNTLNNIHALIDIDAEKAKSTVIELSKLMRYVLYDSAHGNILLGREIEFLEHYIALMRLRYCDKVRINVSFPEKLESVSVPPLLFVSFVENAFKHGISYQWESFIDVSLKIEGNEIFFNCKNSKHENNSDTASGIGLENVRKRLRLLFGSNYLLNIDDKDNIFEVLLVIPIIE